MNRIITWAVLIAVVGGVLIFAFSFVHSQQLTPCVEQWEMLTAQEKAACDEQVGGRGAVLATRDALQEQTVQALPSFPPSSGLATETADYAEKESPTPDATGTAIASSSEIMEVIEQVEPQETAGGGVPLSLDYRFMANVWRVGAIEDNVGVFHPFYVSTPKNECSLITVTIGMGEELSHAEQSWPCPQEMGELAIIGVTGPTGIVTFTTTLSQSGTFNLATEEWTLEGKPWLPGPTVTPP